MIGALARKFFGSANDRRIKGYQSRVDAINALEPELAALSDEDRAIGSSAITAVRQTGAAAGAAISGVAANLAGFTEGITPHNGAGIAVWVFASVIPLAVAGTWAAFRLTGSAEVA